MMPLLYPSVISRNMAEHWHLLQEILIERLLRLSEASRSRDSKSKYCDAGHCDDKSLYPHLIRLHEFATCRRTYLFHSRTSASWYNATLPEVSGQNNKVIQINIPIVVQITLLQ